MGLNSHFHNVLIGKEVVLFSFMNETRNKCALTLNVCFIFKLTFTACL